MKTALTIIVVALLVLTPSCNRTNNQPQHRMIEVETVDHVINFYNIPDLSTTPPFLTIRFFELPEIMLPEINAWQDDINKTLREADGVFEESDYGKKLSPIIVEYSPKFIDSGASAVAIEFPRKKQGMLLYDKRRLKK